MRLVHVDARPSRFITLIRRFRPTAALLSAGLMLAGCGVLGGASGAEVSGGGQTLTVAAVPGVDDAPLYVARKEGLFQQHGLKVTIRNYQTVKQEIAALNQGQADIAAGDYANFFYAASHGKLQDLRLIADGYDAAPSVVEVLTRAGSPISSPQQLAGKTIATPEPQAIPLSSTTPYSLEMMATEAVLRNDGISASSITWVPMPEQQMVGALKNRKVDAILVTEPYILQAQTQLGAVPVLDSCSGVTAALPLLGYFGLDAYTGKHTQAVQAFKAAMARAQTAAALRGPVQTTLVSSMDMTKQDAALLTLGDYPTFLNTSQVQRVADLMYDAGMINSPLAVRALLTK